MKYVSKQICIQLY